MPSDNSAEYGPRPLDLDTPNAARLYDCFLGGAHNTATDRKVAREFAAMAPHWTLGARLNRSFLRHAVQFMVDQGIDQFLDLGSGIPTVGNVHEIAQQANPDARVVYVDYEPVAYGAAHEMLADNPNATILHADLREPGLVLNHPETRELLDFSRPVGLLIVGVLLFLPPEDGVAEIIATYADRLVPGSFLAISQASHENVTPDISAEIDQVIATYRSVNEHLTLRGKAEIASWFAGTELVEPGLVPYPDWRFDDERLTETELACRFGYVGVGRKQ
ncbi:MAG TPA: SAM-dependent methyltransferase [Pseudonocardiaceae bacterium]|jgi:hypothetical protein